MDGCLRSCRSRDNRRQTHLCPRLCRVCNCGSVSESEPDPSCRKSSVPVECGLISGNPPAVQLQNAGLGRVEPNLVILQADRGGSGGDGAGWLEDQLPLALPEEQAEGDINAEHRESEWSPASRRGSSGRWPAAAGAPAGFSSRGGRGRQDRLRRRLCAMRLAEGEFVRGFERGSTDTAKNGGAVAAHQWILYSPGASRAPEICRCGRDLRYCWRWNASHQFRA